MEQSEIKEIISGDVNTAIHKFLEKYNQVFSFPELNQNDLRTELWDALFRHLKDKNLQTIYVPCLSAIRILSRDKSNLNEMMCERWISVLLYHSGLQVPEEILEQKNIFPDYSVVIEALKCLCNLVYNSTIAQTYCCKNGTLEGIIKRLLTYRDSEVPHEVKYFDMKLLFIITALCAEIRPKLRDELHGITYLIETLDLILKESHGEDENFRCSTNVQTPLTDNQINLACEILKVLFNLAVKSNYNITVDEEEEAHYLRLVIVLHDLLLTPTQSLSKRSELQSHIINLLTALPSSCFKELVTNVQNDQDISKDMEYEGHNMEAIYVLLTFLKNRFTNEPTAKGQNELLSPVLTVLLMCANSSRIMRKYLRYQILPPLKDVHNRPEQGTTLRNHLCRMLTTPIIEVRDLAAELLFVLCKENVSRMIKYTGYGNAAGLFANRGLMIGGRSDGDARYSSESEDSDTEEYKEYRHGINEVIGCYEPPHPDPTFGMTDEQKEYEAMKLVELMHNLRQHGMIQPCRVGEDGRPEPIEHVLQLQEDLPRQQVRRNSDSS